MNNSNLPLTRQTNLVVQDLKDELLIYDLAADKAYCLNETAAMVFRLCDGRNSVFDISRKISESLKQTVTEDIVSLAIFRLKTDNLLANGFQIETKFEGLSRREIVKKIGFTSMVALPIISSLIAPTAVSAQSALGGYGSPCTSPSQCASGFCGGNICRYAPGVCGCVNPGGCLVQTTCASQVNCNGFGQCAP